ncbi:hypothetical protein Tco_0750882 [Tanacetum coccineum]|uniref:Uncharacterized protein n=1 Tax=Tanacetum coccineum TaxID=301880 RepID=A0ABQ4Z3Z2_9ASTR
MEGESSGVVEQWKVSQVEKLSRRVESSSGGRVEQLFTSAVLHGKDWEFSLPPFDKGWNTSICTRASSFPKHILGPPGRLVEGVGPAPSNLEGSNLVG